MKKILTVLVVLAIVIGSVFAASGDSVKLNSTVGVWRPVIKIGDGGSSGSYDSKATTTVNSSKDISEESITWYFALYQSGSVEGDFDSTATGTKTGYAKYRGDIKITVSIAAFTGVANTDTAGKSANHGTNGMKVEAITAASVITDNNNKLTLTTAGGANTSSSLDFTVKYNGRVKDQDLGMAKCTWAADETLEPGAYQATITLTYAPEE